ncbi:hypothetical protein [uncultured Sutterella sp.]|uniref:hypothetical protein n=1 Tax=uncultured Sutterella sp. TaxID=286133 RepID=UPI002048D57D|nr:hypothetical protein [uncultured Sutterella sp.]DAO35576.1 MAG TPA: Pyocin activator protein PrtN [Caudoviricetes sp.]
MDNTTLLMDQAAAAAFMGISVTTFKRRRYSDKTRFPKPVEGFSAKLFWKREDIRRYVEGLGYMQNSAAEQTETGQKKSLKMPHDIGIEHDKRGIPQG